MIAYLPELKRGTQKTIQPPNSPGQWEEREVRSLLELARSLEVPESDDSIYSVPDAWARAILFRNALYDDGHTLHEKFLGEWRGLLAILALRDINRWNWLRALKIDLPQPKTEAERRAPLDFVEVAARLKPRGESISPESTWDSIYVFYRQIEGEKDQFPLAFTSPMTLVCTGANSRRALEGLGIPWFNGKTLDDPVSFLTQKQKIAVAEWVMIFRQVVLAIVPQPTGLTGNVISLLEAFARALDSPTSRREKFDESVILGELPKSLPLEGRIWMVLGRARSLDTRRLSDLDLDVPNAGNVRYILIEENIADQWSRSPQDIRVFNDITLGDARSNVSGYPSFSDGQFEDGVRWVTKDFFFHSALIAASGAAAFPALSGFEVIGQRVPFTAVPPLKNEPVPLFGLASLLQSLTIDWESSPSVTVTLALKLKSGATVRIKNRYEGSQLAIVNLSGHLLGIWPNFTTRNDGWKIYYFHHSWPTGAGEVRVQALPSTLTPQTVRVHPGSNPAQSSFQIIEMGEFPRAVTLSLPSNSITGHSGLAAGILPLQRPLPAGGASPIDLVLGVDFGSTGSNIYYKVAGSNRSPAKLNFEGHIYPINKYDKTSAVRFPREFVRDDQRDAFNLLSIFQDFVVPKAHERALFRDGHVLDLQDPEEFSNQVYGKVHTDLKWKGIQKKYIARDFLYQLMLQSAAEAVTKNAQKVEVRFSYPTAYSDGDLHYFRSVWHKIKDQVREATGVAIELNEKVDCRESLTAARFFTHSDNPIRLDILDGGLSIDIGGGTSDYAFYRDNELLGHTSILFAGRDIFLAPLRRNHHVLHEIADFRARSSIQALDNFVREDEGMFNAYLDAVIVRYGDDYTAQLGMTSELPAVLEFLEILSTGLAGIMFFGGMTVRLLMDLYEKKKGKSLTLPRSLKVHIGGNGCNIFDWLFRGSHSFVRHDEHYIKLVNAFKKPLRLPDQDVELVKSREPKAEVAFGLLADDQIINVSETPQVELAGEFHYVGDAGIAWDQPLDSSSAEKGDLRINRDLKVFRSFLASIGQSIDRSALDNLGVSVDIRINALRKQIADAREARAVGNGSPSGVTSSAAGPALPLADDPFSSAQGTPGGTTQAALKPVSSAGDKLLRSEPLFIMTLKQLLDDHIRDWAKQYGR